MGKGCTDCFFACYPYVDWIDNQRKQFDKQKNKYDEEIKIYTEGASSSSGSGNRRLRRAATTTKYDGYESKFYKIFKGHYSDVNDFLGLLNNEKACTAVNDTEGGKINFKEVNTGGTAGTSGGASGASGASSTSDTSGTNDETKGTFYRSKYCQPCPDCGVKHDGKKWEAKEVDDKCKRGNLYKPRPGAEDTPIKILKSGEGRKEIENKLNEFCDENKNDTPNSNGNSVASGSASNSDSQKLYEDWNCYKGKDVEKVKDGKDEDDEDDVKDYKNIQTGGGLCILQKTKGEENVNKQKTSHEIQKTYNDFFNFWVAHMLKDSIYWKKKLERCLENGTKKCGKNCKDNCDCFQKWIEQKKEQEWSQIKKHFYTQDDIVKEGLLAEFMTHDIILEGVLKLEFYKEKSAEDNQN
ncbi:hypothetical protein PFTANZ_06640, partial [Plasmodium falciparum Tanzania (2000708)]